MSTLTVIEYISVDGVAQAPGHAGEDTDGEFTHGGWAEPQLADHREYGTPLYQNAAAFIFGRRTYELWQPHWSSVTDPGDRIAAALNSRPKYVASTTLADVTWANTTIWSDRVPERAAELKASTDGEIVVAGSLRLVQTLITHRLVDAYQVWVHPVLLGQGKRLMEPGTPAVLDLRPVAATITRSGLAVLTYGVS